MTVALITLGKYTDIANTSRYIAFPTACRSGSTIVASWSDKSGHFSTASDSTSQVARSLDGGLTWSKPVQVTNLGSGNRGAVALATFKGRWAMLQMESSPYIGYVSVTSDPMVWPAATVIPNWLDTSSNVDRAFPCHLAWLDDGSADGLMLATGYYGEWGVRVTASRDAGRTWTPWAHPFSDALHSETTITQLNDGRLMMLVRVDPDGGRSTTNSRNDVLYSSDWGRTWSEPVPAIRNTSAIPWCGVMPDGTLVVTCRDMTADSSPQSWALAVSQDQGASWTTEQIDPGFMMYGVVVPTSGQSAVLVGSTQLSSTDADVWAWQLKVAANPTPVRPGDAPPPTDPTTPPPVTVPPVAMLMTMRRAVERWLVGDFVTGEVRGELPITEGSWSTGLDRTTITAGLDWWTAAARAVLPQVYPWTAYLAVTLDDQIMAAGPLLMDDWDGSKLTLHAQGAEAYFARRTIMNREVMNPNSRIWTMYDPDAKKVPSWAQLKAGGTWGQIIKPVIDHVMSITDVPGFPLPQLQTPPIRCDWPIEWGKHQSVTIDAIDHITVKEWLDKVQGEADGVEWMVRPRWKGGNPSSGFIEWNVDVGAPLLGGRKIGLDATGIRDLKTSRDGSRITTGVHAVGGRQGNKPITWSTFGTGSRLYLETVDSSHSQAEKQAELAQAVQQTLATQSYPILTTSANAPTGTVGQWDVGDYLGITGDQSTPYEWASAQIPHLPALLKTRVVSRSGTAGSGRVDIEAQMVTGGDADAWDAAAA